MHAQIRRNLKADHNFQQPDQNIRMPVWAGKFYPAKQSEIKQMIESLTQKAKNKNK